MIAVGGGIALGEDELKFVFVRAGGPGGQKVNKSSSAVQLRFDVAGSASLSQEVKGRLVRLAGSRLTAGGVLVIQAWRYRSQKQNRADAVARLVDLIRRAASPPKRRVPTRATRSASQRRLEAKKRRARLKSLRRQREQ
jgi:ribosome-associated protein